MRPSIHHAPIDLATLRRLWKPLRDSYANAHLYRDNRIRIHRAFSWMERAAALPDSALDERYLAQWAGFAALHSRWDAARGQPVGEPAAIAAFVRQLFATDHDGVMAGTVERERPLVTSMFTDRYLARHCEEVDAKALLERRRFDRIVRHVLERCALVHAQLARGGATYGSRENRTVLKRSSMVLEHLSVAAIQVVTNHGYADDWGDLCWPPARG